MSDDKVVPFEKRGHIFECVKTTDGKKCGTISFIIYEDHYECTSCGRRWTFDQVHGEA